MLHGIRPQDLLVSSGLGQLGRLQRSRIVAGRLGISGAARSGPGVFRFHLDPDAALVVGPNGTSEDDEPVFGTRANPDVHFRRKHEGPDVEGRARSIGHPARIHLDQLNQRLMEQFGVHSRHAHPVCTHIESRNVGIGPEQRHTSIGLAEGLHAFEDGLPIMQGHGGRTHGDVRIGLNGAGLPLPIFEIHHEHVIREDTSEREVLEVDLSEAGLVGRMDVKEGCRHHGPVIKVTFNRSAKIGGTNPPQPVGNQASGAKRNLFGLTKPA